MIVIISGNNNGSDNIEISKNKQKLKKYRKIFKISEYVQKFLIL
jgi:hypothetical protein